MTAPARPEALDQKCAYCGAPAGEPCQNWKPLSGCIEILTHVPHAARICAAERAKEPRYDR